MSLSIVDQHHIRCGASVKRKGARVETLEGRVLYYVSFLVLDLRTYTSA